MDVFNPAEGAVFNFIKRNFKRISVLLAAGVMVLALSQCDDDPLAPFEPEINSATDNFQLQATGVTNRTATLNYNWVNTGTQASVDHSTSTSAGSARVNIYDADGNQVYATTLAPSKTDTTAAGPSGTWRIQLIMKSYSGTLNFRVQKQD